MSWRTVVVSKRCKLDLKMGYMVIRGEETCRVFLDEIAILMIENPAVSMTGCLLEALVSKKIRVVFCDSKRSPMAELTPYHDRYDMTRKLHQQMNWNEEIKGTIWSAIISDKISKQADHLMRRGKERESNLLKAYVSQVEFQDITNREGHAAKVYFNSLFGLDFSRHENDPVNIALDYGYSILLSAFNREICASGYLCDLGIHHDNVFNHFNLSSDLMEPFRILVDIKVFDMMPTELTKDVKYGLIDILNTYVSIEGSSQTVLNTIRIYLKSVFEALCEMDPKKLSFYEL